MIRTNPPAKGIRNMMFRIMNPVIKIHISLVLNLKRSTNFLPTANDTKEVDSISAIINSIPEIIAIGIPIKVTAIKIIKTAATMMKTTRYPINPCLQ